MMVLVTNDIILDFISSDSVQSMMCAVGRIHNSIKVVFCMLLLPLLIIMQSLLTCIEHIRWKIPDVCVNTCWVYSVESVSKVLLVLAGTFLIFFTICGVICAILSHSSLGDREYIFITHLVIIKSEVSTIAIVVIFFHDCVPEVVVPTYAGSFIYIPGKQGFFYFFITVQSYDVRKQLSTLWPDGRIRLCADYTTSLSPLCKLIWRYWTCKVHFVECVSKIVNSLSYLSCNIWAWVYLGYPFYQWWLWEYVYLILLSSTNNKYDPFAIV